MIQDPMTDGTAVESVAGFRTRRRTLLHIAVALIAVSLAAVTSGCGQPDTAGNTTIHFTIALQDDRFHDAYNLMCADRQAEISEEVFTREGGGIYSRPSEMQNGELEGSQYRDEATMGDDISRAWTEMEGTGAKGHETWRFQLVQENGRWRVCGLNPRVAP